MANCVLSCYLVIFERNSLTQFLYQFGYIKFVQFVVRLVICDNYFQLSFPYCVIAVPSCYVTQECVSNVCRVACRFFLDFARCTYYSLRQFEICGSLYAISMDEKN
jgi:hypothetical protein